MKKQLTEKIKYEPNNHVTVTVENKPEFEEGESVPRYEKKVTIVVKAGVSNEKLQFAGVDDIEKWVNNIDFEDPQLSLLEDGPESEDA